MNNTNKSTLLNTNDCCKDQVEEILDELIDAIEDLIDETLEEYQENQIKYKEYKEKGIGIRTRAMTLGLVSQKLKDKQIEIGKRYKNN